MTAGVPLRAARVLVRTGLRLAFGERLVLVHDDACRAIADAVEEAAAEVGAWVRRIQLDRLGTRPLRVAPELLAAALAEASASVFVARALHQEAPMRQELLHLAQRAGLRHAHLPGVSEGVFVAGLAVDQGDVAKATRDLAAKLTSVRTLFVDSPGGTALRVELAKEGVAPKWFSQVGVVEPGSFSNFPAGALYASPASVDGLFVADASLGEFFGAREGSLAQKSVRFYVEGGRVTDVECEASPSLCRDIEAMLSFSANSARIGLVALGANFGIEAPLGDALLDQNYPGLHLGVGDPAGRLTGAGWSAPTCFAACEAASRVIAEGELIVQGGKLGASVRPRPPRKDSPTPAV
jgi:leucyl aminopeptidase (aminopeptidase T)